jgi:nitrous oxidase accessory protein
MLARVLALLGRWRSRLCCVCANGEEPARKIDAAAHGGVRADVDRPKPTFMLHERDKRVHGLKPFQELVDKAPAGSTC